MSSSELDALRAHIDALDEQIVRLLNQRTEKAVQIGALKRNTDAGIYVPAREKAVLDRVCHLNTGPLNDRHLTAIYREIMSASISLQHAVNVAFLGPASTYSHQAARARFGSGVEYMACSSIPEVFAAVEKGNAQYGVAPIENSIEGGVTATQDMLVSTPLKICAEVYLSISHHLLAAPGRGEIQKIISHPQALAQCRLWLDKNHPGVEQVAVASTAAAAETAAREPGVAAIAGSLAAEMYKLEVLASGIQDNTCNTTRFLILGDDHGPPTGSDKTSLYFGVQHKVGALMAAMQPFHNLGINLLKIESRPSKAKNWEYFFFVDIEGHVEDDIVRNALTQLATHCNVLHILGSYPRIAY